MSTILRRIARMAAGNTVEGLAASLPQAEPVILPYSTYVAAIRQGIREGYCRLCTECNEPIWEEAAGHHCYEISRHIYPMYYAPDITREEAPLYEHHA